MIEWKIDLQIYMQIFVQKTEGKKQTGEKNAILNGAVYSLILFLSSKYEFCILFIRSGLKIYIPKNIS